MNEWTRRRKEEYFFDEAKRTNLKPDATSAIFGRRRAMVDVGGQGCSRLQNVTVWDVKAS